MNHKKKDIAGQRFGRLVAVEPTQQMKHGVTVWKFQCDCGNSVFIPLSRAGRHTSSCGCLRNDTVRQLRIKHGESQTRLYSIWKGMNKRCSNPATKSYEVYGGRGISVCDEWKQDYNAFREWALSHGYDEKLTLDRINNDLGYSPNNCKWATKAEQSQNRRHFSEWRHN